MSRTEDSYRTELINEINSSLLAPYRAYNSMQIKIINDDEKKKELNAEKREFDIVILDNAYVSDKKINPSRIEFVIETKKLNSKEDGIKQAEDAFVAFPSLIYTFATNFESLYYRKRNEQSDRISLKGKNINSKIKKVAEIIVSFINEEIKKKTIIKKETLSEKEIIETLKECMENIQNQMTELPDESKEELTKRTLIMWKNIDEKESKNKLQYNYKRAAAYIIIDQFLFYHLLQQKSKKYKLPELNPLDQNEDNPEMFYTKYINRAIKETGDYRPILDIDLLSFLPKSKNIIKILNEVIEKIKGLKIETQSSDFIGKIFHNMIPSEIRKPLAAYYTNSNAANLLARLSIKSETDKVCDLACGSGTLLVESYHVLYEKYKQQKDQNHSDEEIHRKLLEEQIYGNDITLFATHLAAINLAAQCLDGEINKINITTGNGLGIYPNNEYSSLLTFGKMNINIVEMKNTNDTNKKILFPYFDVVIMNPPFSKHKGMGKEMKDKIFEIMDHYKWFDNRDERKKYIDVKMGLHGYFILHADHFIEKEGRMAMVLPTSTFTSEYGKKIILYLKEKKYSIPFVIEKDTTNATFSEDCGFKEYIVIFEKGMLSDKNKTKLISIFDEILMENPLELYNSIISNKLSSNLRIREILTMELYSGKKWTELFNPQSESGLIEKINHKNKLESYQNNSSELKITYGFNGTYSEFLMIPNKYWDIQKLNSTTLKLIQKITDKNDEQKECTIPLKYCVPAIRKSENFNCLKAHPDCYVLNLPPELPFELSDFHRKYLHFCELLLEQKIEKDKKNGHKRVDIIKHSFDNKKFPWYSHASKNHCERTHNLFIIGKYGINTRKSLTFYSEEKCTVNNIIFGVICKNDKFYLSWIFSTLYLYLLTLKQQIISKGYFRMLLNDFDSMLFPKYDTFTEEEKQQLISKIEEIMKIPESELPTIPNQIGKQGIPMKERVELDNLWLKILGVPETEIDKIRDEMYSSILLYLNA